MKIRVAVCLLLLALSVGPLTASGADGVASVFGNEILRSDLGPEKDEPVQVVRFRDLIWERVARHYVAERGLAATDGEVAEFLSYHREFDRRDRAQRARKLEELNQRLAKGELEVDERAWLEEFRAVLTRLAQHDAEKERSAPPDPEQLGALSRPWLEMWKMNKALHEQYGGAVAVTRSGPEPFGARAALIRDYERQGRVRFYEPRLREALFALLTKPPSVPVPPERVDFTPYWKLPIPPSYLPD